MATIEEIIGLEHGAGRSQADVQQLINELRQKQTEAEAKDKDTLNTIQGVGKTAMNFHKLRKDFLLAKRANPDLTLKEFFADDKVSAEYMKKGVESIASGKSPGVTLNEILGFSNPMKNLSDMQASVDKAKSSNMYKYPLTQETAIQSPGLNIKRNNMSMDNLLPNPERVSPSLNYKDATARSSINSLQELRNAPMSLPIESVPQGTIPVPMLEEVLVTPTSVLDSSTAIESASTATDSASAAADSASAASSAGLDALGTAGSALGLASSTFGEEGMFTDALTPKNYLNTAGNVASILSKTVPGLQPLGIVGAGAKGLSRLLG
tara:strand:- start:26 stop:994 length:969 start_codon:yes stop_codon:yes gene_type:complete